MAGTFSSPERDDVPGDNRQRAVRVPPGHAVGGRREQANATRSRVLKAAAELLAERGYDGVRVQQVATRAGVTTGAIYAHFPDRAALLANAVAEHANSAFAPVVGRQRDADADPVRRALLEIAGLLRERPSEVRPALEVEALVAARRDERLRADLSERLRPVLDDLICLVRDAAARGAVGDVEPAAVAYLCYALALGTVLLEPVAAPRPSPAGWLDMVDRLLAGLRGPAPAAPAPPAPAPASPAPSAPAPAPSAPAPASPAPFAPAPPADQGQRHVV